MIELELDEDDGKPEENRKRKVVKPRKVVMCPHIMGKKKCPDGKECLKAHNPMELDLLPVTQKIKNLKSVIGVQQKSLKASKNLSPWVPANANNQPDSK